jgi:excisionase family DNA binding protein
LKLKNKYFSLTQVAELKGFSTAHLRRMILSGKILAEKVGKSWLIEKDELDKIIRQRTLKK